MNKDRYLVVVSGPSGCGKDTVVKTMREKHPEIEVSVSATSRAMREGEAEGVNYYYMTREAFQQKVQAGKILEYTQYNGNLYGTPKHEVDTRIAQGRTVILVIEVEGAGNIRKLYPEALTIFLLPPSREETVCAAAAPRVRRPFRGAWPPPAARWSRPPCTRPRW